MNLLKWDKSFNVGDSGEKILLVAGSLEQLLQHGTILETEGYEILRATDGMEALDLYGDHQELRLIVTDLDMDGMDGYELIQNIRQRQMHYAYIIGLSDTPDSDTVIRALSGGADDVLYKPVRPEELILRLRGGKKLLRLAIQDELIFSLAKLADYRSEETGLHLNRVQGYSLLLGNYLAVHNPEMGVSPTMAREISKVSPLHDIGKVGIADSILDKPGRLTGEEFREMTYHTVIGGELLGDIYAKTGSSCMKLAYEVTMYHHEQWNGCGYPAGLSGDTIPVSSRIVALADVYDALSTERVYKKAFDHEKSRSIIADGEGKHFDPRVVQAFFALEQQFEALSKQLKDN